LPEVCTPDADGSCFYYISSSAWWWIQGSTNDIAPVFCMAMYSGDDSIHMSKTCNVLKTDDASEDKLSVRCVKD